jgi:hypothetical protein
MSMSAHAKAADEVAGIWQQSGGHGEPDGSPTVAPGPVRMTGATTIECGSAHDR